MTAPRAREASREAAGRRIDQACEDAKIARVMACEAPSAPGVCAFVACGLGVAVANPLYIGALEPCLLVRSCVPRIDSDIFLATPLTADFRWPRPSRRPRTRWLGGFRPIHSA